MVGHRVGYGHGVAPGGLHLLGVQGVATYVVVHARGGALGKVGLQAVLGLSAHEVDLAAAAVLVVGLIGASLVLGPRFAATEAVVADLHHVRLVERALDDEFYAGAS